MGRVLVTGGAKGMGAAIVRALVAGGHDVTFTVRSSGEAAEALVADLKASHPDRDVAVATLDLADKSAVDTFCAELEKVEPFYGLVHNAGQPYDQLAAVMDQAKAEAVMQINFFAFTRLVGALVRPMMRARPAGSLRSARSRRSGRTRAMPPMARQRRRWPPIAGPWRSRAPSVGSASMSWPPASSIPT